jgi:hypothetical protein
MIIALTAVALMLLASDLNRFRKVLFGGPTLAAATACLIFYVVMLIESR